MSSVYIPPPGAMQFELKPEQAEIAGVPFFWVTTDADGTCRQAGHPWLRVHNPSAQAVRYAKQVLHNSGRTPVVCICHGRIIE
jgi:hypothetical protein